MVVITTEPFGFFMVAAMAGVIVCSVVLALVAILTVRGGEDE